MLENFRFHADEEENDGHFSQQLAGLGDLYVDDAFGDCASRSRFDSRYDQYLPAVAGLLLEKEINSLSQILEILSAPSASFLAALNQ